MYTRYFSAPLGVEASYKEGEGFHLHVYIVHPDREPKLLGIQSFPGPAASEYLTETLGLMCKFDAWKLLKEANPAYDAPRPRNGLFDLIDREGR
jgi:hypothetical protein